MATLQGMCKNCGSLIMFSDRDDECECVFCNIVFPSAEAVEIMNNPDGYEFPNDTYEPSTDIKRHTTTRVYSDENIKKAIKREELSANNSEASLKPSEFEISPNDIKAPAKVKSIVIAVVALCVILVIAIWLPLYNSRTKLTSKVEENFSLVYEGIDNTSVSEDNVKFSISGQSCQNVKILTSDITVISKDDAELMFANYCALLNDKSGKSDAASKVTMEIYSKGEIWTVTDKGATSVADPTMNEVTEATEEAAE